jgi:hypothetical protein
VGAGIVLGVSGILMIAIAAPAIPVAAVEEPSARQTSSIDADEAVGDENQWTGPLVDGRIPDVVECNDAYPCPPEGGFDVEAELGWDTNLDLIESLKGTDACLYRHSVYPAGGVGYADSSLPYDDYPPQDAAFLTLRAETLRSAPAAVMDVTSGTVGGKTTATIVALASPEGADRFSLEALAAVNQHVASALSTIHDAGADVVVEWADAPSLLKMCEMEDRFPLLTDDSGAHLTSYTDPLPLEHVLEVTMNVDDARFAAPLVEEFAPYLRLTTMEGRYELLASARANSTSPWRGGSRMYKPGGAPTGDCSTSFRVNGNSILTADHCGWSNFYNVNGIWMGTAGYSQQGGNYDAMVLAGSTYSNQVWLGPVDPTSTLPAYGVYAPWTLSGGVDYLLASGSFTGQGTLLYLGPPSPDGCLFYTNDGKTRCGLYKTLAPSGICGYGDSGGPVAVYDPANGRLIPTGILTSSDVNNINYAHDCMFTGVAQIAYNYGGATIG